jgi:hypothetical protein
VGVPRRSGDLPYETAVSGLVGQTPMEWTPKMRQRRI